MTIIMCSFIIQRGLCYETGIQEEFTKTSGELPNKLVCRTNWKKEKK